MEKYRIHYPASLTIPYWNEEGYYDVMLNDPKRLDAYRKAIMQTVKPGMVVLDLGTGTGILAQYALEAGAARVYGIESNDKILKQAVQNLKKFEDKFVPVLGMSNNVELSERVDIIISEMIGNFGDNENFTEILNDAQIRFLKPNGIMLPKQVVSFAVPVYAPSVNENINLGNILYRGEKAIGLTADFYDVLIPQEDYMAKPETIRSFRFDGKDATEWSKKVVFNITKDGLITGIKGWFAAKLNDEVVLDIEPIAENHSWNHFYYPFPRSLPVRKRDILEVEFSRKNRKYNIKANI